MTQKRVKKTKFNVTKIPRYLPGSVPPHVWKNDLKEFNQHRYRCYSATTKLDTLPSKMNPFNYVNETKLRNDVRRLQQIDADNKELLKRINKITRTRGVIDSYNPNAFDERSKWDVYELRLKQIEKENKKFYKILQSATSHYTRAMMEESWRRIVARLKSVCRYPLVVFEKPSKDHLLPQLPSISGKLEKNGDRPRCFLEFQTVTGQNLGRIIIELYRDHVPITVTNFLTLCDPNNRLTYKNCKIHRIIPGQYCETGDIIKNNGTGGCSIYGPTFPEENHKLKHTKFGVLSMIRNRYYQRNHSQFCITFDNCEKLDKKNVVFGCIIKGIENLMKLEGYGRNIGKPLLDVYINNCGVIT